MEHSDKRILVTLESVRSRTKSCIFLKNNNRNYEAGTKQGKSSKHL